MFHHRLLPSGMPRGTAYLPAASPHDLAPKIILKHVAAFYYDWHTVLMSSTPETHTLTTTEVFTAYAKEFAKSVPFYGWVIGGAIANQENQLDKLEKGRIWEILNYLKGYVERSERSGISVPQNQRTAGVFLYTADQARGDLLASEKADTYARAAITYSCNDEPLSDFFEVLSSIRNLSSTDLKLLVAFRDVQTHPNPMKLIAHLCNYYDHYENEASRQEAVHQKLIEFYPAIKRLEGLGLILMAPGYNPVGDVLLTIANFGDALKRALYLTPIGKRVVRVLPE